MRSTNLRDGVRFLALVALLCTIGHRPSEASGIIASIEYTTTGTIGTDGMAGSPVISFQGVDDGRLTTGGTPFKLGDFFVSMPEPGTTTKFDHTPFTLTFTAKSVDGLALPDLNPISLNGSLIGSIGEDGQANILYYSDGYGYIPEKPPLFPTNFPPFEMGKLLNFLSIDEGRITESRFVYGSTSLYAAIESAEVVPEPSTAAIFVCLVSSLMLVRPRRASWGKGPRARAQRLIPIETENNCMSDC